MKRHQNEFIFFQVFSSLGRLMSFFIGLYGFSLLAAPAMPADPHSGQAYGLITHFFHMDQSIGRVEAVNIAVKDEAHYQIKTVSIRGEAQFPEIRLKLRVPKERQGRLPVIVFFAGFQTGDAVLDLVGDNKEAIYVGFQYPMPLQLMDGLPILEFYKLESISAMMAGAMKWLFEQDFVDQHKVNVVSVSFGTLFYPLAQRLLLREGYQPRTITFGYGGADIPELIEGPLKGKIGVNEMGLTKLVVRYGTWFVDPLFHLRHLQGPFLVVRGAEDEKFPVQSHEAMLRELPEPKTVVTLPGPHISPDRQELIGPFMQSVYGFIQQNNGI